MFPFKADKANNCCQRISNTQHDPKTLNIECIVRTPQPCHWMECQIPAAAKSENQNHAAINQHRKYNNFPTPQHIDRNY